jgi:signal transduction histidine kinase
LSRSGDIGKARIVNAPSQHLLEPAMEMADAAASAEPGAAALSTLPASHAQRRLALATVLVSTAFFIATAPFATVALPQVPAFIPVYQAALVVNDLITAILLFGQFAILGSPQMLVLAGAYLFTALMAAAHALTFPGLFAPTGLLGAGPQSTAWMYMFWHAGFPLCVLAYAHLGRRGVAPPLAAQVRRGMALGSGAAAIGAALALLVLATAGAGQLPAIMQGNRYTPAMIGVVSTVWLLSLGALVALWRRRTRSVLDIWLMVVMSVWLFDIALSAVLNAGRFDLGFYAGRIYGLLAASFVLVVLLLENGALHARLLEAGERERASARDSLARQAERLRIVHEIDRAIMSEVRPGAIAAAVLQPLRQLLDVARVNINLTDDTADDVEWFASAGRHRTHIGSGLRFPAHLIGDVNALRRGEPQRIDTRALPAGPERDALLASGVNYYMAVPMIAGGNLVGAVSFGGEHDAFPEEQVTIALEVATQLAVAIGNARLYEKVQRLNAELEGRVQERTRELESANKDLESFSYSVSHDLRAPLRAVDGYAQMLEEDYGAKLDAEGRRLLGVVRGEAARMGRLIDDLLKFSQVGRRSLARSSVDMHALASEVVAELSAEFPKARVVLGRLPAVPGDRALLKQVWLNLVANALKYSSRAQSPRIEIGGRSEGGKCVYTVRDNGAGFDMRFQDKLFKVFQRLHRQEDFEGTGVGLAIVQRVIERHGGRIWAEAVEGQGASFQFALPEEG